MPPKNKKCSICGTNSTARWIILSRKTLCDGCYDVQCNPPLEPRQEDGPDEPVAGPSGLGRKSETILATGPVQSNPADDGIFLKPTFIPPRPAKIARQNSATLDSASTNSASSSSSSTTTTTSTTANSATHSSSRSSTPSKAASRNKARKSFPSKPKLTDETKRPKSVPKVFHNDYWYEVGDIVSLVDTKDNTYYAQIRALVVDVFNEKHAILTWLVPTTASPPPNEGFDPATYHIGPDEDKMRNLSEMQFVMHAPSGYYLNRCDPYPRKYVTGPVERDGRSTEAPLYDWANICQLHLGERPVGK
ncbi:GATA zinc finger domain-containing protein 1-like [Anopheles merus]|uniref:GATA zinc finger domain-containing protein 1 n=1 Tax=Anopheles merus TaxID=30066 RepID=A0A182V047_ANOME|nr:GATA zinc finger domain-containing protein 1-like [Anopheles merus]